MERWSLGASLVAFVLLLSAASHGRELPVKNSDHSFIYNHTLAKTLVEYASAVYMTDLTALFTWTCSRCNDLTQGFEMRSLIVDVENCLQAFVGVAHNLNSIIVAIRGTQENSVQNWVKDLIWKQLDLSYPNMPNAKVHSGFFSSYNNTILRLAITSAVNKARKSYGDINVIVTGHSMGGAMASFCALDLAVSIPRPSHRDRGSMRRSSSPGTSSQIAERERAGTAAGTPAELDPAARPRRLWNSTAPPWELDAPPRELDRATAPGTEGQAACLHRGKTREAKRKRSAPINQHREGGRPSCLRFIRRSEDDEDIHTDGEDIDAAEEGIIALDDEEEAPPYQAQAAGKINPLMAEITMLEGEKGKNDGGSKNWRCNMGSRSSFLLVVPGTSSQINLDLDPC